MQVAAWLKKCRVLWLDEESPGGVNVEHRTARLWGQNISLASTLIEAPLQSAHAASVEWGNSCPRRSTGSETCGQECPHSL